MKTTSYCLTLYHHSDEESMDHINEVVGALKELLPHADVEWESCKSDYGHVIITIEDLVPF